MVTESDILTNYLLQPAPLPSILTFDQFRLLFPRSLHASPQLRSLYRNLQAQRNSAIDAVTANIAAEVQRGTGMRREVRRQRRAAAREELDGEMEMERALFGNGSGLRSERHSLASLVVELEGALGAVEAQMQRLEEEEGGLRAGVESVVGGMSDLRYGRMGNGQLREEVLAGLAALREACERKS